MAQATPALSLCGGDTGRYCRLSLRVWITSGRAHEQLFLRASVLQQLVTGGERAGDQFSSMAFVPVTECARSGFNELDEGLLRVLEEPRRHDIRLIARDNRSSLGWFDWLFGLAKAQCRAITVRLTLPEWNRLLMASDHSTKCRSLAMLFSAAVSKLLTLYGGKEIRDMTQPYVWLPRGLSGHGMWETETTVKEFLEDLARSGTVSSADAVCVREAACLVFGLNGTKPALDLIVRPFKEMKELVLLDPITARQKSLDTQNTIANSIVCSCLLQEAKPWLSEMMLVEKLLIQRGRIEVTSLFDLSDWDKVKRSVEARRIQSKDLTRHLVRLSYQLVYMKREADGDVSTLLESYTVLPELLGAWLATLNLAKYRWLEYNLGLRSDNLSFIPRALATFEAATSIDERKVKKEKECKLTKQDLKKIGKVIATAMGRRGKEECHIFSEDDTRREIESITGLEPLKSKKWDSKRFENTSKSFLAAGSLATNFPRRLNWNPCPTMLKGTQNRQGFSSPMVTSMSGFSSSERQVYQRQIPKTCAIRTCQASLAASRGTGRHGILAALGGLGNV